MFPLDQLNELRPLCLDVATASEGGVSYVRLTKLVLPKGCTPPRVDALLCPTPRDGYSSRLFFAERVTSPVNQNWNGSAHVLGGAWHAFSWALTPPSDVRLAQLVSMHLAGLRGPA